MTHIGEVIRLTWPTAAGLITLVAVTAKREQLHKVDCEPADEWRETYRLYALLWQHALRPVTPALPVEESRSLRLVS